MRSTWQSRTAVRCSTWTNSPARGGRRCARGSGTACR
ncbi:hypothetical protein AB0H60_07330 [Nocardia rhamnosiphila]